MGGDHIRERHWLLGNAYNKIQLVGKDNAEMEMLQRNRQSIWESISENTRMDDGVAYRVDRFRAIGNGQVPAVARLAWEILSA
jgi:DNA (cytosine-5)-methyltransferase 1